MKEKKRWFNHPVAAAAVCFIIFFFTFCNLLTPYGPPSDFNLEGLEPTISNFSSSRSDAYELIGHTKICGNSSTIFFGSANISIHPYARKQDKVAMNKVRNLHIISQAVRTLPHCSRNLSVPAVIFSTGGYAGNYFHDFSDVLIPLYLTSRHFNGSVIFFVTDHHSWWTSKYRVLLEKLSRFSIVDLDNLNNVVCSSRTIVGLKSKQEFGIHPLESSGYYSTRHFTEFLRRTYSLQRKVVPCSKKFGNSTSALPRMLIISRRKSRHLKNEGSLADIAQGMGFQVTVEELGHNVSLVSQFVNSFDVMIGIHGAGLTNMVFLPEGAVVIQIIPIGLDIVAKPYFQLPAHNMNLRYLEYKVSLNESSLLGRYPRGSEVYKDPSGLYDSDYPRFRSLYLDNQDINLDLDSFRKTLLAAMELLNIGVIRAGSL